jgi:hypothetical protein
MNKLHTYLFGGHRIGLFDKGGGFVVVTDVTKDFFFGDHRRTKRCASIDGVPFNFGEPDFDMVKPGRVGGVK